MPLTHEERHIMQSVPPLQYYEGRIDDEAIWGEHELYVLDKVVSPGGTAIDVGANQGFFAFALSKVAVHVEAFEPNPDYAEFARHMLASRATVHQIALSDRAGTAEFEVPLAQDGAALHLGGRLSKSGADDANTMRFTVETRTLDSYGFDKVRALKIDVEGSELEVLSGARQTIMRDRPPLIVELLTGAFENPVAAIETIAATYAYSPLLVTSTGEMVEALPVVRSLNSNTTWGSSIRNRNVLFLPK